MLALTRAQAPRENIRPLLPLDLAAWLPQALAERIPDALQAGVAADAWSLRELLDNLLDNAFKHAAGSMVTVSLGRQPQQLRLAIDDAGSGLD